MNEKQYPRVFKKAIKGSVGGRFINSRGEYDEFLLIGDPAKADIENVSVEIVDEEAEKYFLKNNKLTITNGYLVEITDGTEIVLDEVNAVNDSFLKDLLKQPYKRMEKRVNQFTSPVPVSRLLALAREENRPVKTIEFLQNALNKLDNGNPLPNIASIGDVKIGGATG